MINEINRFSMISYIKNHNDVISSLIIYEELLIKIGTIIADAISNGNKLLIMGNGGSAADSQHFASELIGKFKKIRKGYPAIALTTDSSVITSIANDLSFSEIFARQIQSHATKGDIVIGISTSGKSENIIRGIHEGKKLGCITLGLLGNEGGKLIDEVDHSITVRYYDTQRIQEAHIFIIHILCEIIENKLT
jgi:D-sedoheptulose 7-phosphate isomerase